MVEICVKRVPVFQQERYNVLVSNLKRLGYEYVETKDGIAVNGDDADTVVLVSTIIFQSSVEIREYVEEKEVEPDFILGVTCKRDGAGHLGILPLIEGEASLDELRKAYVALGSFLYEINAKQQFGTSDPDVLDAIGNQIIES